MIQKIKTTLLFIFGLGLAGGSIYLGLLWMAERNIPPPSKIKVISPEPTISTSKTIQANLKLNPDQLSLYENEILTVSIWAESETKILGVDLEIKFDPNLLEFVQIEPGKLFSQSEEINKEIVQETGHIFYALGSFSAGKESGLLATLQFRAKPIENTQQTTISLESPTNLAVEGFDEVKISLPISGKYTILNLESQNE